MADKTVTTPAKFVYAPSEADRRFFEYMVAKANYETQSYSASIGNHDLPDSILDPLYKAMNDAENALLMTPADEIADLKRKLMVFRDTDGHDRIDAGDIVDIMYRDAERICNRFTQRGNIGRIAA